MSDPESIRARRLAKLSASTTNNSSQSRLSPTPRPTPRPTITTNSTPAAVKPSTPSAASPLPVVNKPTPVNKYTANISIEDWTNNEIEYIFQCSLSKSKSESKNYLHLESLSSEYSTLSFDLIDNLFIEILTDLGIQRLNASSPFEYLSEVWSKSKKSRRLVKTDDPIKFEKFKVLDEILRLSSSYSLILFQVPDMFTNEVDIDKTLNNLMVSINYYDEFLVEIITRSIENDSVLELLNIVIPRLSAILLVDFNNYNKIIKMFELFVSIKSVASQFYLIDGFNSDGLQANEFETKTILGPLLRVSPLLTEISGMNYQGNLLKTQIRTIHESLHSEHNILLNRLFGICDKLVRSNERCRAAFLKLLGDIVNKNHLRRGEHADPKKIATDSLMFNLTIILCKFCQPFIIDDSKTDKIDLNYLNYKDKLIDLQEETKINSTIQEYDEIYDSGNQIDRPLNFISECFFLTLTYIHYGLGGLFVSAQRLDSYIKQLTKEVKKIDKMIETQGGTNSANPMIKMFVETKLNPLKKQLQEFKSQKLSIEMCSYNRELQLEIFDVIIGSIKFFVRLIEPTHTYPNNNVKINIPFHNLDNEVDKLDDIEYLRQLSPVPFKYFPEIFIEGLINYCHYISKFNNNPMFDNDSKLNDFVEFAIIILRCPELVSNPHLKSRLTEVLFFGSLPLNNGNKGYMIEIFNNNETVKRNLMFSLLDFYVMVEKTGSNSQFYDKFNSRCHIAIIIEQLWNFEFFKNDLKEISKNNLQFFVRLIARMLNDTTFLLDESLNKLQTIGSCQREIANRAKGKEPTMTETDEELAKILGENEHSAKSYVQLSNKTIHLFNLFTKEIPRSFIIIEIVDRLAGMLNYNLVQLVGPKCNNLRVKDPESYQFNPSDLLYQLCSIFVNLSDESEFIESVAKDERSFNSKYFEKALFILNKFGLLNQEFENKLVQFIENANEIKLREEEEEVELGEIPDEFLDPLMFTLMKDPVKLPHSKISIDRSVLKAHLMNDSTDPFNRTPLKLEDVSDDVELRNKINAFIREKKGLSKDEDVVMN